MDKAVDKWLVGKMAEYFGENSSTFYWLHDYWEEGADPRTKGYFLVDISGVGILAFLSLYLLIVFAIIPEIMRKRKPLELKNIMFYYNIIVVLINAYFFFKTLFGITRFGRELWNFTNPKADTSEQAMDFINTSQLYYFSKILDFFDTFFMAFKRKTNQITFLHIWHHVSMAAAGWMFMKYNPCNYEYFLNNLSIYSFSTSLILSDMPTCAIIPIVNGFIHVVMYSYYALAALGPKYQKYLWWKKYMTQMQLGQFTIALAYFVIVFFKQTDLPAGYLASNLGNATFLFILFSNFYFRTYNKKKELKTN